MNELNKFSDIEVKYENSPFRILHITLHCIDIHDNSQIKYIKYQFTTPPVSCRIKYITYTVLNFSLWVIYYTSICFKNEQAMQLTTTMLNNIKQGLNFASPFMPRKKIKSRNLDRLKDLLLS